LAAAEAAPDFWAIVDGKTWLELGMHGTASVHVRVTWDAGGTWTSSTGAGPAGWHLMAVSFVSATDGWAIFEINQVCPAAGSCPASLPAVGEFAETHDGGLTWLVP
jgi:hypothetical protein